MLDSRGGMDVADQLRDAIIDEIVTGRLRAGAKIPTMQEIARLVRRGEIAHPGKAHFVLLKKA